MCVMYFDHMYILLFCKTHPGSPLTAHHFLTSCFPFCLFNKPLNPMSVVPISMCMTLSIGAQATYQEPHPWEWVFLLQEPSESTSSSDTWKHHCSACGFIIVFSYKPKTQHWCVFPSGNFKLWSPNSGSLNPNF